MGDPFLAFFLEPLDYVAEDHLKIVVIRYCIQYVVRNGSFHFNHHSRLWAHQAAQARCHKPALSIQGLANSPPSASGLFAEGVRAKQLYLIKLVSYKSGAVTFQVQSWQVVFPNGPAAFGMGLRLTSQTEAFAETPRTKGALECSIGLEEVF